MWHKALYIAGIVLVVIAALRPWWDDEHPSSLAADSTLWIVLDVSRSMLTRDVGTSRLERAQEIALQWVQEAGPTTAGVIAFAGQGVTTAPLTRDISFVRTAIKELSIESAPAVGSNLEHALSLVPASRDRRPSTVLLLTDGGHDPIDVSRIGATLKENGNSLVVVGIGDPDKPHPIPVDGQHLRDSSGQLVHTSLEEDRLKSLAAAAEGAFVPAGTRSVDVADVARQTIPKPSGSRYDALEPSTAPSQWLAAVAVLVFSVHMWTSAGRWRK